MNTQKVSPNRMNKLRQQANQYINAKFVIDKYGDRLIEKSKTC